VKAALALFAVLVLAAGAAVGFALHRTRDPVPERVRECVERAGADTVKARESLGAARPDALAGRRLPARTMRIGDDRALLMQGADYAVLVVRSGSNPPLGTDPLRAVYRDPSPWALVAVERDPVRGVLARCAR
jgi:hypothetical protein